MSIQLYSEVLKIAWFCRVFKGRERFVGVFTTVQPQLMLIEPDLIQQILISDFRSFHNNESSRWVNREVEPIAGANPFVLTDDIWKEKRAEIVQGLTISKIKTCYPIVKSACQKLTTYIKEHAHYSEKGFDVNDLSLRYTGEVVCDTVWGIEAGSFKDKTNCTFVDTSKKTINQTYYSTIFYYASQVLPFIRNFYSVRFFPVESDKFFSRFLQDAIDVRSKNGERGDFLQYMINLQEKKHLSNTDLVGHQLTFLFDGFETSAVVIAHTLLCVSVHLSIHSQDFLNFIILVLSISLDCSIKSRQQLLLYTLKINDPKLSLGIASVINHLYNGTRHAISIACQYNSWEYEEFRENQDLLVAKE